MPRKKWMTIFGSALVATVSAITAAPAFAQQQSQPEPLVIREQGSFSVGGTVQSSPGTYNNNNPGPQGQSFHGDHLYTFYQVPQNAKPLPIVMLHGAFQSARSWETTPDGREGFQTLFLHRGFPVYLVDQPRRGRAGNSTVAATIEPTPNDQLFFDQFRLGVWLLAQHPWIVPIPGTTKLHRLEENIGAAAIALNGDDLDRIDKALAGIEVKGARYPASHQSFVNR